MRRAKNLQLLVLPSRSREAQQTPASGVNTEGSPQLAHLAGDVWKMVTFTAGLPWSKGNAELR
jgi:hypothetical protein